jgi:hypothetical protein
LIAAAGQQIDEPEPVEPGRLLNTGVRVQRVERRMASGIQRLSTQTVISNR